MIPAKQEVAPHYDCAHTACQHSAEVRYVVRGVMARLCKPHYEWHTLQQAKEFTKSLGLETVADCERWCKEHTAKTPPSTAWAFKLREMAAAGKDLLPIQTEFAEYALRNQPERVPGEDDDL